MPVAVATKTRVSDTVVTIDPLVGRQVQGFDHAIIYDDEIATGGSVVELSQVLTEHGVGEITVVCTHGLFLGKAIDRLGHIHQIREIVTTDTVPIPRGKRLSNMTVLSVAPVFGEAIERNYWHESLGDLFAFGEPDDEPVAIDAAPLEAGDGAAPTDETPGGTARPAPGTGAGADDETRGRQQEKARAG
jgi:hypothetical protein